MGKTYAGNTSDESAIPKKIYVGNGSNQATPCKIAYCGDSNGKAVEVWRNSTLPSTYQKVEYIYNTNGTEYINTGVKANSDTRIHIKINQEVNYVYSGTRYYLFGCYDNAVYIHAYTGGAYSDAKKYCSWGDINHPDVSGNSYGTGFKGTFTLDINRSNGNSYSNNTLWFSSTSTFTSAYDYLLFAYNDKGTTKLSDYFKHKVYFFQVWQARTMIRDMYPCYLKSDTQVVGMYDLIGNQFYGNSGTGIFYKGPDVN